MGECTCPTDANLIKEMLKNVKLLVALLDSDFCGIVMQHKLYCPIVLVQRQFD